MRHKRDLVILSVFAGFLGLCVAAAVILARGRSMQELMVEGMMRFGPGEKAPNSVRLLARFMQDVGPRPNPFWIFENETTLEKKLTGEMRRIQGRLAAGLNDVQAERVFSLVHRTAGGLDADAAKDWFCDLRVFRLVDALSPDDFEALSEVFRDGIKRAKTAGAIPEGSKPPRSPEALCIAPLAPTDPEAAESLRAMLRDEDRDCAAALRLWVAAAEKFDAAGRIRAGRVLFAHLAGIFDFTSRGSSCPRRSKPAQPESGRSAPGTAL